MYKIAVFIPSDHLETVKSAMFDAGAGHIGNYECCAWQCPGQGQFRGLADSNPYIGKKGQIETVEEYKVEMVCSDELIQATIVAMKHAHPYEEPAYDVWRLADL